MTRAKALLMVEKDDVLKWPRHTRFTLAKKHSNKYCRFHRKKGHDIEECYQLKDEIERLVRQWYFKNQLPRNFERRKDGRRSRSRSRDRRPNWAGERNDQNVKENAPVKGIIHTIAGGMDITNFTVHKVLIDNGSWADIIFKDLLVKMGLDNAKLEPVTTLLVGFGGNTPFAYNVILGRPKLNSFRAIVSTYHLKMKLPTQYGIGEVACNQIEAKRCYNLSLRKSEVTEMRKFEDIRRVELQKQKHERIEPIEDHKEIELVQGDPLKTTRIGSKLGEFETFMIAFLRGNVDMFAWDPFDFKGINLEVIVHRLNVNPSARPVQQKKRTFEAKKNRIIEEEVYKLLRAGYVSELHYTDWLGNAVMVPKASGKWRMCTDFTDLNKACPKDPYLLPRIDLLVDSTAGYEIFSMMDGYQGYHQIFMATEDREKTYFVTDRGIFLLQSSAFSLKNAGATYQKLVNKMFAQQIGKTMEVYVDDMLIKSQKLEDHLTHLETAFATMRRYGMKLNPSKCTFGVGGGKFLGYMISGHGIEANPKKIDAILKLNHLHP
ncbi:UNVERIFIED_CONTAM: Retrovirus-related Pol polyprotein from transposon opus [Sesamum indicum]